MKYVSMETLFSDAAVTVNSTNVTNTEDGQISGKDLYIYQNHRIFFF